MGGPEETLYVEIAKDLKELVDADSRYNRQVVEAALWSEFGGHRDPALERRINEQKKRVIMIEEEIESRKDELKTERKKLEAYQSELENRHSRLREVLDDSEAVFTESMLTPDNPAVQKRAKEAGVEPEEFIDSMRERLAGSDDE